MIEVTQIQQTVNLSVDITTEIIDIEVSQTPTLIIIEIAEMGLKGDKGDSGDGATPYSEDFTYTTGQQEFTIPVGVLVKHVFRGRIRLFKDDYTIVGTTVTITYDTLESGEKISITN